MSGALTQSLLLSFRNDKLKHILRRCGWAVTGTKNDMTDRILDGLKLPSVIYSSASPGTSKRPDGREKQRPRRILSVDMGIKNLAVCVLTIPNGPYPSNFRVPVPDLTVWQNFSVLDRYMLDLIDQKARSDKEGKEMESRIFQSDNFAPIAVELARDLMFSHKPDIILLERQRHRSMGGRNILEWTVRVNMLESMLQAIFRMLIDNGSWENGKVISIDPRRVVGYWLDDLKASRGQSTATKSRTYHTVKSMKKSIVEAWLLQQRDGQVDDAPFRLDKSLEDLAISFTRKRKSAAAPGDSKIDDLSDSLLQGIAFVEWEWNREKLREGKMDDLD